MIFCIAVIILSVAADQISKYLAVKYLSDISTLPIIKDVFHFTYVENRGAAFGMLSDHRWVFMIMSVCGIALMIVWLAKEKPKNRWIRAAVSLVIGGGIGNMIDRLFVGYVVDFIDCRFIDFYVFNIADSCVCVGCALFVVAVLVSEAKEAKLKKMAGAGDDCIGIIETADKDGQADGSDEE